MTRVHGNHQTPPEPTRQLSSSSEASFAPFKKAQKERSSLAEASRRDLTKSKVEHLRGGGQVNKSTRATTAVAMLSKREFARMEQRQTNGWPAHKKDVHVKRARH